MVCFSRCFNGIIPYTLIIIRRFPENLDLSSLAPCKNLSYELIQYETYILSNLNFEQRLITKLIEKSKNIFGVALFQQGCKSLAFKFTKRKPPAPTFSEDLLLLFFGTDCMESTCGKAAMSYELKKDAMRTILT